VSALTAPLRRTTPAPDPQRRDHLRVVEEPRQRHTLRYALLIIVVLGAAIFGTVAVNALAATNSVQSRELSNRVAEAEREYAFLVADVASLEDPARIREAGLELGLVPATGGRHLLLQRPLPADGAVDESMPAGATTDPLKPVLSVER
jgi:hypothetical protein